MVSRLCEFDYNRNRSLSITTFSGSNINTFLLLATTMTIGTAKIGTVTIGLVKHARGSILRMLCLLAAVCLLRNESAVAADRVPELLKLLPNNVNSVSIIRIDEMMKSQRAVAEKWKEQQDANFLAGSGRIPGWVETLVRGTDIHSLGQGPIQSVALAPQPAGMTLDKVLPAEQVVADQVGKFTVWRSNRYYITQVTPDIVGVMSPPNRQSISRWFNALTGGGAPTYSKYIQEVTAKYRAHILYAIDLTDFFDPAMLANRVQQSAALKGKEGDAKALTALLLKLQGMRLAIDVDSRINAAVAFDFLGAPGPVAEHLKPLLIELLDDAGARIEDLSAATVKVDGHSVSLVMPLSDPGLRRLMTLILTPISINPSEYTPNPEYVKKNPPKAVSSSDMGQATLKYFELVNNTVRDLQILNRRAKEYDRTATWHDTYATKIQNFPTTNVDPEAVQYASYIAGGLQTLASSLRGLPVQVDRLGEKVTYKWNMNSFYGPGGVYTPWGYQPAPWEITSNIQEVRQAQQAAIDKSVDERDGIWNQMLAEKARVGAELGKKYGLKFP